MSCTSSLLIFNTENSAVCKFDQITLTLHTAVGIICAILLLFVDAPYGKLKNRALSFLPTMDGKLGWIIQEITSPIAFLVTYLTHFYGVSLWSIPGLCLSLWLLHYVHRSIIFPLWRVKSMSPTNIFVVAMAVGFNLVNGWSNAKFLIYLKPGDVTQIRAIIGLSLFAIGMIINIHSDSILISLRSNQTKKEEDNGEKYKIPYGGMFEYVSCANYFGEIIEWLGYAIFINHCAAWIFVLWTCANLVPRALSVHRWYAEKFGDRYPKDRKAVIPFIL